MPASSKTEKASASRSGIVVQAQLEHGGRAFASGELLRTERSQREAFARERGRAFAQKDLIRLRHGFEPRSDVHDVADDGVLHALVGSDVADDGFAGVDPDRETDFDAVS